MIILPQGFKLLSSEPIDARIVLTKEEMKNINPNIMPNVYFALCKDDGKLYLYNKNNSFNDIFPHFFTSSPPFSTYNALTNKNGTKNQKIF